MNGYQLLNEVGSGGTLSSLFTILSLFTEDVKMSWQDENPEASEFDEDEELSMPTRTRSRRSDSDVSRFDLDVKNKPRRSSVSSTASTVHPDPVSPRGRSISPSRADEVSEPSTPHALPSAPFHSPHTNRAAARPPQIHLGVVARATEDTTLAVIPAEAFRRLTKVSSF